jgi:hypothetical protein
VKITGLEAVLLETPTNKTLSFDNHQGNGNDKPSADAVHSSDLKGLIDEDVA